MDIAVDVDGVLADRVPALLEVIHQRHGVRIEVGDVTGWHVTEPHTGKGIRDYFAETDEDPDHLLALPIVDGAVEGMRALAADHELLISTYRKPAAREPTVQWLRTRGIPFDTYVREVGEGKREVPADLLIDDSASTVRAFAGDEGRRALLFRQPWNVDSDVPADAVAVTDWRDVVRTVSELSE